MNIFNTSSVSGVQGALVEPVITVSSEVKANISDRVHFYTQTTEFGYNGTFLAFIFRANAEAISESNKKGFILKFDKNIKPGSYSFPDPNFPFMDFHYFEIGTVLGAITSFAYKPQSGTFTVGVIENSEGKLHYTIGFNFKGINKNEELKIEGTATLIVLMRPM